MSSWKQVRFSEICDITRGGSPRPIQEYMTNDGVPWIKISDATASNSRFIEKTKEFIKTSGISKSREVFPDDLILSNSATPGIPKFMRIYACIHDGWLLLRNFNGAEKEFIYWLLLNERDKLIQQGNGSVFTNLKTDILKNHIVNIPDDIEEQKRIATILNNIQEKIELNTQINQTLEQIAQTIFKSWFIDFDPVHAKANALASGQTLEQATQAAMAVISGKNTQELHRLQTANPKQYQQLWEIAEAFPSGVDEEGVPWGWEEKPLPELIDFLEGPGIRNWQYTEEEDGIKFINIRCIKNGDLSLETANKITREEAFGKYAHFQLKEDDIVISTSGTLGRFALVRNEHLPLCLNTSVIRFRPIENKSTLAFLLGLASNQLQYELEARASGSVQRNFGPTHLKQISVLLPDFYLLSLHNKYISTLFELRKSNLRENDLLMKTRDVLLPKLLSGEV
ncbi:restriction endonuclease subunit S [Glaesserella parasuis]|uniref:restriction endonuclease subunit S n=1 Tax=Glaesserella parasuis TaxID=738 RepID=UPI0002CA2582|nr:restriction endonuclease subunit S [Glaesserella parasuis]EMY45919.1 putative type I restriction enzyme HindVIIP specificity protein [Glaesserella parasuis gx033]MDG6247968.1 restriction endonuclease subunit S [Glaesserella parasuis]MDG6304632.1 restriction endonuclease subunit S [Glaesserella parasuis]MDG6313942.1 restriction endonuclease subunit S [Glaesserella parasuis]MDG6315993.1 restriction endonuclease subunit S [Glaesserella parasuis]